MNCFLKPTETSSRFSLISLVLVGWSPLPCSAISPLRTRRSGVRGPEGGHLAHKCLFSTHCLRSAENRPAFRGWPRITGQYLRPSRRHLATTPRLTAQRRYGGI